MSPRRSPETMTAQPDIDTGLEAAGVAPEQLHRVKVEHSRSSRRKSTAEAAETIPEAEETLETDDGLLDGAEDIDLDAEAASTADSVRQYYNEIGKVALLTAEDEVDLAKRIEAGLFAAQIIDYRKNDPESRQALEKSIYNGVLTRLEIEAKKAAKERAATEKTEDKRSPQQVLEDEQQEKLHRLEQVETETADAMIRIARLAASTLTTEKLREVVADGETAKLHMIKANLRLVVNWAKRFRPLNMELLDVISEGNIGLNRGVQKFDYTQGYKFSTYGSWWIRQAISRAIADQDRTIRIPVHRVEKVTKLEKTQKELQDELMRAPTEEELADAMDMTVTKLRDLKEYSHGMVSLDQTVGESQDATLGDFTAYDGPTAQASAEQTELKQLLQAALGRLDAREEQVMRMRFGIDYQDPMTLDDIAKVFKLSRERIRQIERDAKVKLRKSPLMARLRDYLD